MIATSCEPNIGRDTKQPSDPSQRDSTAEAAPLPDEALLQAARSLKAALADSSLHCFDSLYARMDYRPQWSGRTNARRWEQLDSMLRYPLHFGILAAKATAINDFRKPAARLLPDSLQSSFLVDELAGTMALLHCYKEAGGNPAAFQPADLCADSLLKVRVAQAMERSTPFAALRAMFPDTYAAYMEYAHRFRQQAVVVEVAIPERGAAITAFGTALRELGYHQVPDSLLGEDTSVYFIRQFQREHGLEADGVPGSNTIRAMKMTDRERMGQILANIERERSQLGWPTGEAIIEVNVPEFALRFRVADQVMSEHKVIVGIREKHETPRFYGFMGEIVLNPQWVVPYSIATNELLPKQKRDPSYFSRNNFVVYDRSNRIVSPGSVNWSEVSASSFPYQIVQRDGCDNALGQVKLLFPNQYSVYIHDTPARHLFDRAERDFSHGCIRVENPYVLTKAIQHYRGDREIIDSVAFYACLESVGSQSVSIRPKIPVHVVYRTVRRDALGKWHFYYDLYRNDDAWIDRASKELFGERRANR